MLGSSLLQRRSRSRIPAQVLARGRQRVDALAEVLSTEALAAAAAGMARGRQGMDALSEALPAGLTQEAMAGVVRDLQREAIPLIERATGRTRRKPRRGRGFLVLALLGAAAGLCYFLWQKRDEHPAYLMPEPERPNVTPTAGTPAPSAPPPAPSVPAPEVRESEVEAAAALARSMVDRELAGTHGPTAHHELPRTGEPRRDLGTPLPAPLGGTAGLLPGGTGRPHMPGGSGPSLPH